jgi:hypothetical protein
LPQGLGKFAKDVFDYNLLKNPTKNKAKILAYLQSDCENLLNTIQAFEAHYGRSITLASCAMKYWRTDRQKRGLEIPDNKSDGTDAEIRPYYYGGRVEPFCSGVFEGDFVSYDINSAYPRAMIEDLPCGIPVIYDGLKGEICKRGFYTVECYSHGALPMRTKEGLRFPIGKNLFHATGWEIIAGIETKTISDVRIVKTVLHDDCIEFNEYVEHFYELKKHATGIEREFAKLMMNANYGKWASNPRNYKTLRLVDAKELKPEDQKSGWINAHVAIVAEQPERMQFYDVAIGASITGYVRAYLHRSMCAVREGGGQVLYCDTDSMLVKGSVGNLPIGENLGEWKNEGSFDIVAIAGKKLYAFHKTGTPMKGDLSQWKTACKGVRISPLDIVSVARGETVTHKRLAPSYGVNRKPAIVSREVKATVFFDGDENDKMGLDAWILEL